MTPTEAILQSFVEEGHESLDRFELDLVGLEARPDDHERLTRAYRVLHTLKGTCGQLRFASLEAHAHRGEDVLDALRDGRLALTPAIATMLLRLADELRRGLQAIEARQTEPAPADGGLLDALTDLLRAPAAAAAAVAATTPPPAVAAREAAIRVDAGVLDTLLDLAGELMVVRGRLDELAPSPSAELLDVHRQLRRASGELLETIREARLQPVGTVLGRLPRVVRDLATDLGKQARVELSGEEVGVDRAVNEVLADALLHIARNAIDHGLETPSERADAGKPTAGTMHVAVTQEGGRVRVRIADDGRGIDAADLAEQAVAAGAVSREVAESLSDDDCLELLFRPGVTTRASATSVSGRGVGMDAVRAALGRVGGIVSVASAPGAGTTFTIDMPLTLAVVPCVVVDAAGQRFCLPQAGVREVVRLAAGDLIDIGGARVLRRHGELVPVVALAEAIGLGRAPALDGGAAVVVEGRNRRVALVVDAIGDPLDAVAKPLTRSVREVRVVSGVTIMPDGQLSLIVDFDALAGHLGLRAAETEAGLEADAPVPAETVALLLARSADGRQLGVPMAAVERLERVPRADLHEAAGRTLLPYRGGLLPLVRLDRAEAQGDLEVIVCGQVGFAVAAIDDIATAELVDGQPGIARLTDRDGVAEVLSP